MRSQRGMTLVEVLVAITLPVFMLGGTRSVAQSEARRTTQRGFDTTEIKLASQTQSVCTVNINEPSTQPLVLFASASRFKFESDCAATNKPNTDHLASRDGADADSSTRSSVDTIAFFFQADLTTARMDDFVMMRQMNNEPPVQVLRNVVAYPGRPFFQYYYRKKLEGGRQSTLPVPNAWLPLRHGVTQHGTPADTGATARIDTLRAVEVSYSVTNGRTGADERVRRVSTIIPLSTLNRNKTRLWGDDKPFFSQASITGVDADSSSSRSAVVTKLAASKPCPAS